MHFFLALLSGAAVGALFYWLKDIEALPGWALFIIMGTLWANAAVIPVALPRRYWSFAFIGAMMLFLLLLAGMILASKLPFPHSRKLLPGVPNPVAVEEVNIITYATVLTGGCLGLLYGLLSGRRGAMVVGLALGGASGYVLGIASLYAFVAVGGGAEPQYVWRYDSTLHFAWQGALVMIVLHAGASLGALLGAGSTEPQKLPSAPPPPIPASPQKNAGRQEGGNSGAGETKLQKK